MRTRYTATRPNTGTNLKESVDYLRELLDLSISPIAAGGMNLHEETVLEGLRQERLTEARPGRWTTDSLKGGREGGKESCQ